MSGSVQLKFMVTRDEYVRGMRRHYRSRLRIKRDIAAGIIATIAGIFLLKVGVWTAAASLLIVFGGILLLFVAYAMFCLPYLIYRSQPKLKLECRLIFRPDAIKYHTAEVDAEIKWSVYHSWLSDDEFYILYHGTRDLTVIPRRAMSRNEDEHLREIIKAAIGPAIA